MNSRKRKKFNTKRGVSLVVAIALATVLFLTTTSFISLALLQQKETGAELNTRQAYVSAKSALDIAKEMVLTGEMALPATDGSVYYLMYYSGGQLKVIGYSSAEAAIEGMKFVDAIGNAYIKIEKNGDKCTISSFSSENQYTTDSEDKSHGDLSMGFDAKTQRDPKDEVTKMKIDIGDYSTTSDNAGNRFLLVGAQTNFSLLMSAHKKIYGNTEDFQTLKQYYKHDKNGYKENHVLYIPYLNTDDEPITTQFPLVFTETVKIDSGSKRCTYKVYDDGVYFLGSYSGTDLGDANYPSDVSNVSYFTSNGSYGAHLYCKFIVVNHNMAAKLSQGGDTASIRVNYYGGNDSSNDGVVVYIANDSTFRTFNEGGGEQSKIGYSAGYYWLPNGQDLLTYKMEKIDPENDNSCRTMISKSLYDSIVNKDGTVKELHSAYESESTDGSEVSILYKNGTFQNTANTYGLTERTSYFPGWANYSIYCGPSTMPSAADYNQYYDLYCGDTFNYLWYSVEPMTVEEKVKMSIRSNSAVLTIGGNKDYNESVYVTHTSYDIVSNYIKNEKVPTSNIKQGPYKASYEIVGKEGAEFWIRPYWGESGYSLKVINDFTVKYPGGPTDGYTIYKGNYTNELPAGGINLFSAEGQKYFEDHKTEVEDAKESTIAWVDDDGAILNTEPKSQVGKTVNFQASSGALAGKTYYATVINCDFSKFTDPVTTLGPTELKAKIVSLKGDIQGSQLYINTSEGTENKCIIGGKEQEGIALVVEEDLDLLDETGEKIIKVLEKGYYFFPTTAKSVNLLDEKLWANKYYFAPEKNKDVDGVTRYWVESVDIQFSEGRYY